MSSKMDVNSVMLWDRIKWIEMGKPNGRYHKWIACMLRDKVKRGVEARR